MSMPNTMGGSSSARCVFLLLLFVPNGSSAPCDHNQVGGLLILTYRMSVSYILHEIAQMERNDLRVERVSVRLPGGSCGGTLHWLAARDALDSPVIGGLVTVACA